jgi:hypothetical protein
MSGERRSTAQDAFNRRVKLTLFAFAIVAALFVAEHRAHVIAYLPWLLLAACPLMHLFMHHGHGRHERQENKGDRDAPRSENARERSEQGAAQPDRLHQRE